MIVDIHGHYTTAPAALSAWRKAQLEGKTLEVRISDDESASRSKARSSRPSASAART